LWLSQKTNLAIQTPETALATTWWHSWISGCQWWVYRST